MGNIETSNLTSVLTCLLLTFQNEIQLLFYNHRVVVMAKTSDAYYRVYKALHLVAHEAIPCVDNCLKVWHANQQQALPPCSVLGPLQWVVSSYSFLSVLLRLVM